MSFVRSLPLNDYLNRYLQSEFVKYHQLNFISISYENIHEYIKHNIPWDQALPILPRKLKYFLYTVKIFISLQCLSSELVTVISKYYFLNDWFYVYAFL